MSNQLTTSAEPSEDPSTLDIPRLRTFTEKVLDDFSGAMTCLACALGDRLGLFEALAAVGPSTSSDLARHTSTDERGLKQWLCTLVAAGYLDYEPKHNMYSLPIEHSAVLADEGSLFALAGGFQLLLGFAGAADRIRNSLQSGCGVEQSSYEPSLQSGMERMSTPWFEHLLVQQWLASVPGLVNRLEAGIRVADVGCGAGRATITLARTFPASEFTGYDMFRPAVDRARDNLKRAGGMCNLHFIERDITTGLRGSYDLVTSFNSLHDIAHQDTGLIHIRRSLAPGGSYLILESSCSEKLEENVNVIGTILYGTSFFYSTPVSLANGGQGFGAILPERSVRDLCRAAGLNVRRVATTNPMHALYEATSLEN